ncbi:MAG: hypothetical protein NXI20_28250 [bacterium]|nr:hypothetical protein [bacterium]
MNHDTTNNILWPESDGFQDQSNVLSGTLYDVVVYGDEFDYTLNYIVTEYDIEINNLQINIDKDNVKLLSTVLEWLREDILNEVDDLPDSNRLILVYDNNNWRYTHDGVDFQYMPLGDRAKKLFVSPAQEDMRTHTGLAANRGPVSRRAPRKSNFKVS